MAKFKWQAIISGEAESSNPEMVRLTVISQLALSANLAVSCKGLEVNVEPMSLIEPAQRVPQPPINFDAHIKKH